MELILKGAIRMKKRMVKRLLTLGENKKKKVDILKKRYNYLKSKNYKDQPNNQMKYINYHLKKLGAKI